MDATHTFGSAHFTIAAKELVALHQLFKVGDDDSPEADRIRDALDAPLAAMDPIERKRAQWLSADLYSVSEPSPTFKLKEMNPQAERKISDSIMARKEERWDDALTLLRRWENYMTPAFLSARRGAIWRAAGYVEVALMFYGYAAEVEPDHEYYQAYYLDCLEHYDKDQAYKASDLVLAYDKVNPPLAVNQAAAIRFTQIVLTSTTNASPDFRFLISKLRANLSRIEGKEVRRRPWVSAHTMTTFLIGSCYRFLGEFAEATKYYARGLEINPNDSGLLTVRGILSYNSPASNVHDFEVAKLRSPLIWPHFFLAHHALIKGKFSECNDLCQQAMSKHGPDAAKSQVQEWRAIAQTELGYPPEQIRALFESAIQFDPLNETAKDNFDLFKAFLNS